MPDLFFETQKPGPPADSDMGRTFPDPPCLHYPVITDMLPRDPKSLGRAEIISSGD
ncbi:hypothetical protein CMQ_1387 [Grosmannia clavigera kw1407]|uniref:Uncharacterized protein n=1 Tax=Grosmannia clavigera (strain kw1407 / UAMH 11150) TaxID=655863 RepID=F0XDG8_GROCL|nr:uncharacterized protein CMQ_1387 [Grosmannia clavigera kw1407]EFX04459.1 hypothetical protein CMQ_1387 [Grosmannia clavigera kw1407]